MWAKTTHLLLIIFIFSLILGQLGRISLGGIEGALNVSDLILGLVFISWVNWRLVEKRELKFSSIDYLLVLLTFFLLISLVSALTRVTLFEWMIGLFYWCRLGLYLSLFKISLDIQEHFKIDLRRYLEITGVIVAALGLFQFAVFPDFSRYVQHGWDPHYYRVLSTFFDPNFVGLFLGFTFILILERLYSTGKLRISDNWGHVVAIAIVGIAILLTFSRSTYLGVGIGVLSFAWLRDKRIIVGLILAGLLAFIGIERVRERVVGAISIDETAQLRLDNYQKTWQVIQDQPLLGVGYNTFRYAQEDYGYFRDDRGVPQPSGHAGAGADNSFLFIWATGGILSLLALVTILGYWLIQAQGGLDQAVIIPIIFAVIAHAQFVNSLFYPAILSFLLVTLGTSKNDE